MNTFAFTLRDDWRTLRWLLPVWAGALAINHWLQPLIARGPAEYLTLRTSIVTLSWGALWLFVLSQLVFTHPAAEPRAAWRSRPLRGEWVAAAKLVTGAIALVLLPALVGVLTTMGAQTWPWSVFGERLLSSLAVYAVFFSVLFFIATLCRTRSQFLGSVLALLVGGPVLLLIGSLGLRRSTLLFDYDPWVSTLVLLTTLTGAVTLTARQYRRPRTRQHLRIAAGFVIALAMVEVLSPPNPNSLPNLPADGAQMSATALRHVRTDSALNVDIDFTGLDPDRVWRLDEVMALPTHGHPRRTDFDDDLLLSSPTIARQLGLDGYTMEQTETLPHSVHLESLEADAPHKPIPPSRIGSRELTALLTRLRLKVLGVLPAATGSSLDSAGLKVSVTDHSDVLGGPGLALQVFIPAQPDSASRISRGRPPLWVWVDPVGHRASLVQHTGESSWAHLSTGLRGTFTLPLPHDWNVSTAQLELRVVDVLPEGRLSLHTTTQ